MPIMTPEECNAITTAFATESGRFGPKIYSKSAYRDPIIRLQAMTRGVWTDGMGDIHSHLTYERGFPAVNTADLWEDIAASDDDNDACSPPELLVESGSTTRTSRLRHLALNTEDFCINDIRNKFKFAEQLTKQRNILTDISWWVWSQRYTTDYVDIAAHNITVNQSAGLYDNGSNGYSAANPANAQLEQYHLESLRLIITRDGPEDAPSVEEDTGAPLVELIIGEEMSNNLFRNNPNLRNDMRYALMGHGLNADFLPPGYPRKRKSFGGFVHNIKTFPRRFNIVNGAYVEVQPWVSGAANIGVKSTVNPDWLTASTEEVILWYPGVYRSMVPAPLGEVAPGWAFKPVNYMGEFTIRNIIERTCNPDGDHLFWRARFADAAEPQNPDIGISVLAARCPVASQFVPCNYVLPTANGGYM